MDMTFRCNRILRLNQILVDVDDDVDDDDDNNIKDDDDGLRMAKWRNSD